MIQIIIQIAIQIALQIAIQIAIQNTSNLMQSNFFELLKALHILKFHKSFAISATAPAFFFSECESVKTFQISEVQWSTYYQRPAQSAAAYGMDHERCT